MKMGKRCATSPSDLGKGQTVEFGHRVHYALLPKLCFVHAADLLKILDQSDCTRGSFINCNADDFAFLYLTFEDSDCIRDGCIWY